VICALYRRPGTHDMLSLQLAGDALDFPRTDSAAEARWGPGLVRIASWLVAAAATDRGSATAAQARREHSSASLLLTPRS
jgi:hypothetical protein